MLRLHDTATGEVRELTRRHPGRVSMYVCGPTVYDVPHIGHGRAALTYDVLRRYLEWTGIAVDHVSNITDVDDKIVQRAAEQGREPDDVARQYEQAWYDALDALGVLRPTADPHATAFVPRMVALIDDLLARGMAYRTDDGVYFAVESVADYGLLARQSLESLRTGARIEVDEHKRSPLDFALWKRVDEHELSWSSPWGPGRPGWHTECVVMALDLLGDGFDLHTGGLDLMFPHHENERAQAVAMGHVFARHWMHHAFVEMGGEKMSKSLGNFTSLTDLLARTDPRAYRLLVLRSHYRSPIEVTPATVADAEAGLDRLDSFARRFPPGASGAEPDAEAMARFRALMDDDLRTPQATALLFDLVGRANAGGDDAAAAAAAAHEVARAFGLALHASDAAVDDETAALVTARDEARAGRDFARADELRSELQRRGWVVEDTPEGTRVHR